MGEFLHRFPVPWIDRAGAEVNARTIDAGGLPEPSPAGRPGGVIARQDLSTLLAQAAANRLRRAFVGAVGGRQLAVGAAALVPLAPRVDARPEALASIEGRLTGPGRGVAIVVGPDWLHRVWAAGAAVVDGALVLDLADDGRRAIVVEWPDGAAGSPAIVRRAIRHGPGGWRAVP